MIAVDGLAKAFGAKREIRAVDEVTFDAPDGAITGLLGPNGAGKTTLLRMLATLIVPDAGRASVNGLDIVAERDAVRRRIGVLSDARGLYTRLTARENVRYFGELYGVAPKLVATRTEALFHTLGLSALADRRVQGFSQGERMKVAIARALIHDPPVIMLDEPTNGLDIMSVRALREQLRALRADGKCLLFSGDKPYTIGKDSIVILGRGRVVAQGTAPELVAQSGAATLEDAFVALLGSGEGLAA